MADEASTTSGVIKIINLSEWLEIGSSNDKENYGVGAGKGAGSAVNGTGWSRTTEGKDARGLRTYEYKDAGTEHESN